VFHKQYFFLYVKVNVKKIPKENLKITKLSKWVTAHEKIRQGMFIFF